MTKTITQWLDSLSPRAQEVILDELKDIYYYPNKELSFELDADKVLTECLAGDNTSLCRFTSRYGGSVRRETIIPYLTCLKYKQEGKISEDAYLKFFDENIYDDNSDINFDGTRLTGYLTIDERRKMLTIPNGHYAYRVCPFLAKIINTDDFEGFEGQLDGNDMSFFEHHESIRNEFANEDLTFDYYKKNPKKMNWTVYNNDKGMFDCLFFGKTGWNLTDKKYVVKELFGRYDNDRIIEFFKHIVSADLYWLHSLEDVLCDYRGLASAVFNMKRERYTMIDEDTEADGSIKTMPTEFRFPKDIRKLCLIAHCCHRRSLPKTKNSSIGDAASLVRLYDFKFSDIVDCLYPDNTEPKFMPEPVEQTL